MRSQIQHISNMIQIQEQAIIEAAGKGMDAFLNLFTDAYLAALDGNVTAENMEKLNGYQHTLLAFRFFTDEVREGGFVQLIQNGYGGYVFDNPTAKALKLMGAKRHKRKRIQLSLRIPHTVKRLQPLEGSPDGNRT